MHEVRQCIQFRGHAELGCAMLLNGVWNRKHMLSELHAFTKCDNACSSVITFSSVAQCFRAIHGAEHMIRSVQMFGTAH
jgi:hypothetical protein